MILRLGILLFRYVDSLNLIFINVDNSLYEFYGDIISILKFN